MGGARAPPPAPDCGCLGETLRRAAQPPPLRRVSGCRAPPGGGGAEARGPGTAWRLETWHPPGMRVGGGAPAAAGWASAGPPHLPPAATRVGRTWCRGCGCALGRPANALWSRDCHVNLCPGWPRQSAALPALVLQGSPPAREPVQGAFPASERRESARGVRGKEAQLWNGARLRGRAGKNSEQEPQRPEGSDFSSGPRSRGREPPLLSQTGSRWSLP